MPDVNEYINNASKYLSASDILQNPLKEWTIVEEGIYQKSDYNDKFVLLLPLKSGEDLKVFKCSPANAKIITSATGETNTSKWIGRILIFETYKFKAKDQTLKDAINIKQIKIK